ncbi:hypothetical protein IMCC21906_00174 [Spongiibacter sp. IMCC21906]|nr:hypothetical protein IMCC21906_00174 [Spongiibacter sp. IMCC21906]
MWLWAWWGGRCRPAAFVIAEQGEYVVDSPHVVIPASEPVSRKPPHFEFPPGVKRSPSNWIPACYRVRGDDVVWNVMWLWAWWGGRCHPTAFVIAEQGEYVVDSLHVVIPASEPVSRKPPHFELPRGGKTLPEQLDPGSLRVRDDDVRVLSCSGRDDEEGAILWCLGCRCCLECDVALGMVGWKVPPCCVRNCRAG